MVTEPNLIRQAVENEKGELVFLQPGQIFDTVGRPGIYYTVDKTGAHRRVSKKKTGKQRRQEKREQNSDRTA